MLKEALKKKGKVNLILGWGQNFSSSSCVLTQAKTLDKPTTESNIKTSHILKVSFKRKVYC